MPVIVSIVKHKCCWEAMRNARTLKRSQEIGPFVCRVLSEVVGVTRVVKVNMEENAIA